MTTLPNVQIDRATTAALRAPARAAEITNLCALCADGVTRPRFEVDATLIVECTCCGLVRQDTRPLAESILYDADYYATDNPKGGYANYFLDSDVNRRTFRDRIAAIERRYGRRGRLLDVGCALGDFLLEAKASGWDVEGVEISSFAAQRARERGLRVTAGRLEELLRDASRRRSDVGAVGGPHGWRVQRSLTGKRLEFESRRSVHAQTSPALRIVRSMSP